MRRSLLVTHVGADAIHAAPSSFPALLVEVDGRGRKDATAGRGGRGAFFTVHGLSSVNAQGARVVTGARSLTRFEQFPVRSTFSLTPRA
jgi:hypothetical protein